MIVQDSFFQLIVFRQFIEWCDFRLHYIKRKEEEEMAYSTIGVVVEKSRDNLVFVTEIQTGRSFVVTDKAAKAYQSGDILTLNLTTKTFVDATEDYPFV